jgi:uncharacterized protein
MNCPVCNVSLVMTDRQGVEIDYCPKCRGVWLDRGELDKIIERSSSDAGFEPARRERDDDHNRYDEHRKSDEHYSDKSGYYSSQPHKKHKKRESFLSELFDF